MYRKSTKAIRIGTKPVANFRASNYCEGTPVSLLDSSYVLVGTINSWYWELSGGTSVQQNPIVSYPSTGSKAISLAVGSVEGCISDTVYKTISINSKPVVSMSFSDACINTIVNFTSTDNGVSLAKWRWNFGDGKTGTGNNAQHTYSQPGNYVVTLFAIAQNGCSSDTISNIINIYGTNANAGNDTIATPLQPVQLKATGGLFYQWTPSAGLNNANIADPVATLTKDQTYVVRAFTPEGCETFDSLTISIYEGPEIYVPTAFTPNNDGRNDIVKAIPVGISKFHFLKIYNRWGLELFNTTDHKRGWDGRYKNMDQPIDVYIWITSGIDINDRPFTRKGTLTLIK